MTKHTPATPLPWSTHESVTIPSVEIGSKGGSTQTLWLNKKADAAYIVHAANKYPELVAALRAVEMLARINAAIYDGSPVHKSISALLRDIGEST
jgi:hypothetical protein